MPIVSNAKNMKLKEAREARLAQNLRVDRSGLGTGNYLGRWRPVDRDGVSLGMEFDVWVAPEKVVCSEWRADYHSFHEAGEEIGKLRGWHGFDGVSVANDREVYKGLINGELEDVWFMPTKELLNGYDPAGRKYVFFDPLLKHAKEPTFLITTGIFWSCTEVEEDHNLVVTVDFCSERSFKGGKTSGQRYYCLPVRVHRVRDKSLSRVLGLE